VALIRCDFFSEVLELSTSMTVLLPQGSGGPPPVLYLLHGLTDDDTGWTRNTSIERYAEKDGLAVVMPQVHRSFYADEVHGQKFWTFLSEELPRTVEAFFRVSTRREDTFVAGLSMGGYGAFKWALRQPERFAAAASLSAPLDLAWTGRHDDRPHIVELIGRVYGDRDLTGSDDDLFHLLATGDPAGLPRLMLRCGTEDHSRNVRHNERFISACAERGVPLDSGFGPGGHEWDYWDREIRTVLDWFGAGG
jgi:putative tributyrin esterase